MKHTLSICSLAAPLLLLSAIASAQCSNATLSGPWGFNIQGVAPPATINVPAEKPAGARPAIQVYQTPDNPFAYAGTITFDGKGGFTATFVLGGKDTVSGTYTVYSNCTFTMYGLPFFPVNGVIVGGMTKFLLITGEPGFIGTGTGEKVSAASCTNASPQGNWGFSVQGTYGPSSLNFDTVGILTFDGAGHVSGPIWQALGEVVTDGIDTGTYAVNPDCTFTMNLNGLAYLGIFTNGVTQFYVVAENGNAISGSGTSASPVIGPI